MSDLNLTPRARTFAKLVNASRDIRKARLQHRTGLMVDKKSADALRDYQLAFSQAVHSFSDGRIASVNRVMADIRDCLDHEEGFSTHLGAAG